MGHAKGTRCALALTLLACLANGSIEAAVAADGVRILSEMRTEVHAVLSPEQRLRLKAQLAGEKKKWDDWRTRHRAPSR